jgi:YggT family protein
MTPYVGLVAEALIKILDIITWIIILWVIISWIRVIAAVTSVQWRYRTFFRVLVQLDEICSKMAYPFVRPIRRMMRRFDTGPVDFSPLILLFLIWFVRRLIEVSYYSWFLRAGRG